MQLTVPKKNNSPYSFDNPLLLQNGMHQPLNRPSRDHVDIISGKITGVIPPGAAGYAVANVGGVAGASIVYNPSTVIAQQIHAKDMKVWHDSDGSTHMAFTTTFIAPNTPGYIRTRGTNVPVATPHVSDTAGNPLLDVNNSLVFCSDAACPAHLDVVNGHKMVTYDVL